MGREDLGALGYCTGESLSLGAVGLFKVERDDPKSDFDKDGLSSETTNVSCRIVELEAL